MTKLTKILIFLFIPLLVMAGYFGADMYIFNKSGTSNASKYIEMSYQDSCLVSHSCNLLSKDGKLQLKLEVQKQNTSTEFIVTANRSIDQMVIKIHNLSKPYIMNNHGNGKWAISADAKYFSSIKAIELVAYSGGATYFSRVE